MTLWWVMYLCWDRPDVRECHIQPSPAGFPFCYAHRRNMDPARRLPSGVAIRASVPASSRNARKS